MHTCSILGCECIATKNASTRPAVCLKLLSCVFIHAHLFNPWLWKLGHKRGIHKACCLLEQKSHPVCSNIAHEFGFRCMMLLFKLSLNILYKELTLGAFQIWVLRDWRRSLTHVHVDQEGRARNKLAKSCLFFFFFFFWMFHMRTRVNSKYIFYKATIL